MGNMNKFLKEIVPYLIIIIVVILIKTYIFTPVIVNGDSMLNTLHDKDIMILNKIDVRVNGIDRFDIVVIKTGKTKIIKRVIGLPGETVEYKDNKLYINGKKVKDKYGSDTTYDFDLVKVPDNSYFVLGDNRTDSVDSRLLGPISKNDILGHATFTVFPFNRFGGK